MYRKIEFQYMQWRHLKVLKTSCSVRKICKPRIWNIQTASRNFLGMYPGHEPAKFVMIHSNISI